MSKIRVMSAGAVEGPVTRACSGVHARPGIEVDLSFNTVGALKARFEGGEKTDVIILSFPAIEAMEKQGRSLPAAAPISASPPAASPCATA